MNRALLINYLRSRSPARMVMGVGVAAPANSVAPVISGNVQVGQTLSTTDGTWTGSPTFTYQWKRAGVNIASATANTYVLVVDDAGAAITCVVTGTNGAGNSTGTSNTLTIDVYAVFTAHIEDATDQTTYSAGVWNGVAIGAAAANRKIVIGAVCRNSAATPVFSSGTVGAGSLSTQANVGSDSSHNRGELLVADLTTGTTANISITWSAIAARCGVGVWALYGAGSSVPSNTQSSAVDPSGTLGLVVPAKGIGIGISLGVQGTATTWTGLTERYDIAVETTTCHSGADINSNAGGTINTTIDWDQVQTTTPAHLLAAWGP